MSASQPAILVLGGTGTVGSRLVQQLLSSSRSDNNSNNHNTTILVASRNGGNSNNNNNNNNNSNRDDRQSERIQHVVFDWENTDTWANPFTSAPSSSSSSRPVGAVYLIAPPGALNGDRLMTEFADFARARGTRRFVLQSASSIEPGGPAMGKVHAYLRELGQKGEVEWAVLRPTWFQENFADQQAHVKSIREESKIYSATGEGKIPWVAADDIAAVAARALTDPHPPNTEYMVLGPELLSYSEIANVLSDVLQRKIVHVDLSPAELEQRHQGFGIPAEYARMLSSMDTSIKFGAENRTNDVILAVTGSAPRKFRDFAEAVKDVWGAGSRVQGLREAAWQP